MSEVSRLQQYGFVGVVFFLIRGLCVGPMNIIQTFSKKAPSICVYLCLVSCAFYFWIYNMHSGRIIYSPTNTNSSTSQNNAFKQLQRPQQQLCPKISPYLAGPVVFIPYNGNLTQLEKRYYDDNISLKPNTHSFNFIPQQCRAAEMVAIVIPYRDRYRDLLNFLNSLVPMLVRQQIQFRIFVIEQGGNETFNRGTLMNIGYKEALLADNYTCFILHDVDMYPLHDHNIYTCDRAGPRHMAVAISRTKFHLQYQNFVGGVISFNKTNYEKINGFPNLYFGWGGEDDDIFQRMRFKKLKLVRNSLEVSRYKAERHNIDKTNTINPQRFIMLGQTVRTMGYDGLNSLVYKRLKIVQLKLFTMITVDINKHNLQKASEVVKLKLSINGTSIAPKH